MTPIRTAMAVGMASLAAFLSVPAAQAALGAAGSMSFAPESRAMAAAPSAPAYHTYAWPVRGPVLRGFEPPATPYSTGHRGIDIGAPFGSSMVAAGDGVVAFSGWIGGSLFISIDHPDSVRTTYSWISSIAVKTGDPVTKGQVIGATGHGHPEHPEPHLHFGARVGETYIDPMLLLEGGSVAGLIHLAPV